MQKIFDNPSKLESLVKQKYGFPDFIMMENAALSIKNLILELSEQKTPAPDTLPVCLILCGKGNNGGDGYALARMLYGQLQPLVYSLEAPVATEAIKQYEICKKMGITFVSQKKLFEILRGCDSGSKKNNAKQTPQTPFFIVDCLYGTGFKGQPSPSVQKILDTANKATATRIACDIPTALAFNADYTVTMGEHKLQLFSDRAKQVAGKIIVAPLGIDHSLFEDTLPASKVPAHLITPEDIKLPVRTNKAAHKGTYGHTAIFAGEKAGASIICATAAMNFGSGLTSLIRRPQTNLGQFKISPELMISELGKDNLLKIPGKTTSLVFGPGIEKINKEDLNQIKNWFLDKQNKTPSAVFDAGVFGNKDFIQMLELINQHPNARIVLTPHLLELTRLCQSLKIFPGITVRELAENPELKIKIGKKLNSLFPQTTLVIKSANTFIAGAGQTYIINDGTPALAKGGSGDVLAGMIAALLAQGYTAKDAAITACEAHALAAQKNGAGSYSLTPLKLIKLISTL